MNENCGLTAVNFLRALPEVLQNDENMRALAKSIVGVIVPLVDETEEANIFARIDQLDEAVLDILARDFKVDWWDYSYSIEEKRETLKRSWYVHKHMGTPAAVEAALSAIYPGAKVEEWYTYGGQPYHFRLKIPLTQPTTDLAKQANVVSLVSFYKNLRSFLSGIEYRMEAKEPITFRIGAQAGLVAKIHIPELPDDFNFMRKLNVGGAAAAFVTLPLPCLSDDISVASANG